MSNEGRFMRESNRGVNSLNRRVKCKKCKTTLYPGAETCSECGSTEIDSDWNSFQSAYQKHDIGEAYFVGRMHQIGLQVEHWGIDMRHHDKNLVFDNKMDLRLWEPLDDVKCPEKWPSERDDVEMAGKFRYHEQTIDGNHAYKADELAMGPRLNENRWRLRALCDVKTKANEEWLGKFNLRHLAHYAMHAHNYDVPTFVYMTMVDMDEERVGERNLLTPIPTDWGWTSLVDHYDSEQRFSLSYDDICQCAENCAIVDATFRAPDGNIVVEIEDWQNFDWLVEHVL